MLCDCNSWLAASEMFLIPESVILFIACVGCHVAGLSDRALFIYVTGLQVTLAADT